MIKELKELIVDISNIDTSIDMDDIRMVSKLNPSIVDRILHVRDYLGDLNLPKEEKVTPVVVQTTTPTYTSPEEEDIHSNEYSELLKLGLSQRTLDTCKAVYDSKVSKSTKMSFDTLMKSCVFVHNYIIEHGAYFDNQYTIGRLLLNRELENYLSEIDPDKKYVPANIHDFLTTKNFKAVSTKFFECKGTVLVTSGKMISEV
jgi:hypothetical protein